MPETLAPTPPLTTTPALPDGGLRLADWGVIRVSGADARSFLQGQLTQDVLHLGAAQARLAGYCSPKGRLLASFVVWANAFDELMLACSADLLPAVLKRLSMYVLRARCKLVDASADTVVWGLVGASAAAQVAALGPWQLRSEDGARILRLPDAALHGQALARALRVQPAAEAAPVLAPLSPAAWAALEARSGVARIIAATQEQFVPQMVNLDLVGGIHFQKGCYPGQEVVARSQYRGTLKRRAFLLHATVPLAPGQEIVHSDDPGQPAGQVVLAGSLDDAQGQHDALVELKIAATRAGQLHLGSAEGPRLTLGQLPYALPAEAAA